jgi:hypothetical protein
MNNLNENISILRTHLTTVEKELALLQTGRKASSARARKSLQNIKQISHILRKEVAEHVKNIPTKKRTKEAQEVTVEASEPAITEEAAAVAKPPKKPAAAAKPAPKKEVSKKKKNGEEQLP